MFITTNFSLLAKKQKKKKNSTYLRQLAYSLKKFFMNFLGKFLTLEEIHNLKTTTTTKKTMSIIFIEYVIIKLHIYC